MNAQMSLSEPTQIPDIVLDVMSAIRCSAPDKVWYVSFRKEMLAMARELDSTDQAYKWLKKNQDRWDDAVIQSEKWGKDCDPDTNSTDMVPTN